MEKGLLKKDCEAAAKAHEELKERFADTEVITLFPSFNLLGSFFAKFII